MLRSVFNSRLLRERDLHQVVLLIEIPPSQASHAVSDGVTALVLALPAATGATAILRDAAGGSIAGFDFIFALSHELLTAPVAWYRDAALERRFGLSHPSTSAWLGDYLKSAVILVAGGVGAEPSAV